MTKFQSRCCRNVRGICDFRGGRVAQGSRSGKTSSGFVQFPSINGRHVSDRQGDDDDDSCERRSWIMSGICLLVTPRFIPPPPSEPPTMQSAAVLVVVIAVVAEVYYGDSCRAYIMRERQRQRQAQMRQTFTTTIKQYLVHGMTT